MAKQAAVLPAVPERLIADQYAVDFARPLPEWGAGLPAFACVNRANGQSNFLAIQCARFLPPRARVLQALIEQPVEGAAMPLAHGAMKLPGAAGEAYGVVCPAWSGASLVTSLVAPAAASPAGAPRSWSERDIVEQVLVPVGATLERLAARRITHRAIRLDNLFRAKPGDPVMLGAFWAAPPASGQPAVYDPPYSAMCQPAGRGDGAAADDVYALGVAMLALALGRVPMAGLDDAEIVRRKLDLGSFAALAGEERLPANLADLLRVMLAEDPEHRPAPSLLADPAVARARRVGTRPQRRAQRALDIAGQPACGQRTAALALASQPEQGLELLRAGVVDRWLRRELGDAALAGAVEEAVRLHGQDGGLEEARDALLVMRCVALLDPLAPLCWRRLAFWPDGIGPVLAQATGAETLAAFTSLMASEAIAGWAALRAGRSDEASLRIDARELRAALSQRGAASGLARLRYTLNPLLPCAAPLLGTSCVVRLADLLAALERVAAGPERRGAAPVDAEIAVFVAARAGQTASGPGAGLGALARQAGLAEGGQDLGRAALAHLRLLAALQRQFGPPALPGLAAWLAAEAEPLAASWSNRATRKQVAVRLAELAGAGSLPPMLALIENAAARTADTQGAQRARAAVAEIDGLLSQAPAQAAARADYALRLGQEIAVGAGMAALGAVAAVNLVF